MSNIRAPIMPSAMTAGPEMRWILPEIAISTPASLEFDVEADGAPHQFFHIGDSVVAFVEGRAQTGYAQQHREIPAAHRAFGCLHRIGTEPLVYRYECVLRSDEHTSELQSRENLVCRLPPEKKKQH